MADHSSSSTSSSLGSSTTAAPASSASQSRSLPTAQDSRLRTESPSPSPVAATAPIESRTRSALSSSPSSTKVARLGIQSSPSASAPVLPAGASTQDPATVADSSSSIAAAADQASLPLTRRASSSGTKLPSENIGTGVEEECAVKRQKRGNAIADWVRWNVRSQRALIRLNNTVETFAEAHTTLMEHIGSIDAYKEKVHVALTSMEKQYESICKDDHDWIQGDEAAPCRKAMCEQVESIREELKEMQEQATSTLRAAREIHTEKMLGLLVSTLDHQLRALASFDERAQVLSTRIEELGA